MLVSKRQERSLFRRAFRFDREGWPAEKIELRIFYCITGYRGSGYGRQTLGYWAGHLCIWTCGGCLHWPMRCPQRLDSRARAAQWYRGAANRLGQILGCAVEVETC